MLGQQHCFVKPGGCFGGRESVKERENMHKGQGLNEGFRGQKVRENYYRPGGKH